MADDDDDSLDLMPIETPNARSAPRLTPRTVGTAMTSASAASTPDGAPVSDPLVERLRHEADVAQAGGMTSVAGGAAVIVFGSFGLALLVWLLSWLWFDGAGPGLTVWTFLFVLAFGVVVGLLLRPAPPRSDAGRYVAGAPPEFLERGPLDWPLLGPRLLVYGVRHAQGETVARGYFYDRCALLLRQLGKRGEQMPLAALLISEDETPAMLGKVVTHLDKTGWLGTSSDKSRVWLSAKARQVLMEMGVVPDNDIVRGG